MPDVKMTTPAALSSRAREEETRMSLAERGEGRNEGAMGRQKMSVLAVSLTYVLRDVPSDRAPEEARIPTQLALRTK